MSYPGLNEIMVESMGAEMILRAEVKIECLCPIFLNPARAPATIMLINLKAEYTKEIKGPWGKAGTPFSPDNLPTPDYLIRWWPI